MCWEQEPPVGRYHAQARTHSCRCSQLRREAAGLRGATVQEPLWAAAGVCLRPRGLHRWGGGGVHSRRGGRLDWVGIWLEWGSWRLGWGAGTVEGLRTWVVTLSVEHGDP